MHRDAPGIIEADRYARQHADPLFIEEMRIVDPHADEGRQRRGIGEVVLQRNRGRQLFGVHHVADAEQLGIVFERPGRQHFEADPVGHEIFKGQGRAQVVVNLDRAGKRHAPVIGRNDRVQAEAKQHVALRLGKRRGGEGNKSGGEGECFESLHFFGPSLMCDAGMNRGCDSLLDACQDARNRSWCRFCATGFLRGRRASPGDTEVA